MTGTRESGEDSSDSPQHSTSETRGHAPTGSARWIPAIPVAYSLALASLILGPLLGPGYLLLRDAVSTPRSYATDAALGLGDAAPRAVPQDGLLAALSAIVDGGIVVKVILLLALTAAGWGAARLARRLLGVSLAPQLVAATVAIWNPYVAERLLQGHWSLLTGYAALPWTVLVAQQIRLHPKTFRPYSTEWPGLDRATRHRGRGAEAAAGEPSGTAADAVQNGETRSATDTLADLKIAAGTATAGEPGGTGSEPNALPESRPVTSRRRISLWLILGGILAAAGLTPTGSLLAGLVAILTVGRRNLLATIGVWLLSASPWLIATALSGSGAEPSDPAGVAAFAARAEPGLGTLASLAGLGGIWNGDAVPDSRTTLFAVVSTIVLLAVVLSGVQTVSAAGSRTTRYPRRILLVLAAVSIVLPALGATGWGLSVGAHVIEGIPGAGLLRDTQKYVALAMPAFALCAAAGSRTLATLGRRGAVSAAGQPRSPDEGSTTPRPIERTDRELPDGAGAQPLVAMLFIAALILTLPDPAWGVGGALRPVHYPAAWQRVAEAVDGPGDVAVLPAGMFREFPYSGTVPVLDPAPRMLRSDVLQTGVLPVRGRVVAGEGARAQRVENLLLRGASPAELAEQGVGWILVEHRTPGALGNSKTTVRQLEPIFSDADLTLYRIPGARQTAAASGADRAIALAAHALWATLLLAGAVTALINHRRRRQSGSTE